MKSVHVVFGDVVKVSICCFCSVCLCVCVCVCGEKGELNGERLVSVV